MSAIDKVKSILAEKNQDVIDLRPAQLNSSGSFIRWVEGVKSRFAETYDFDVYLPTIGENLQRGIVWTREQQIRFIEEIFDRNTVLPNVVVNEVADYDTMEKVSKVIDGKQRLTAIKLFVEGEFPVFGDVFYKDVSPMFWSAADRLVFVTYYEHLTDKQLVVLFDKLNFWGVEQDKDRFASIKAKAGV